MKGLLKGIGLLLCLAVDSLCSPKAIQVDLTMHSPYNPNVAPRLRHWPTNWAIAYYAVAGLNSGTGRWEYDGPVSDATQAKSYTYNVRGPSGQTWLGFDWPVCAPSESGCRYACCDFVSWVLGGTTVDRRNFQAGVPGTPGTVLDVSSYRNVVVAAANVVTGGNPVFNYRLQGSNTCETPGAEMHVILGMTDWQWDRSEETYMAVESIRQTTPSYSWDMTVNGSVRMTIPLDPSDWIWRVNGQPATTNLNAWQKLVRHVENIGLTFGGGCFYAHGVNVTGGGVQFQLQQLWIVP